ncbi:ComEC/Rec2 family competence protein [Pseudobdellovibrio exovorus]|uniref:ComEC/Rec2 family competence protein n=1 Tax=Pseudobdellovibrio exovorus TaxID=453816 RepID=UPI00130DB14E|nr:ComEC/Rec2 family competence protein [Pseudobdellovibrio exovorus]
MLIISFVGLSLIRVSFFEIIKPVAEKTHLLCINKLPQKASFLPELKALVCAEDFSTLAHSQIYITTGLIHLFVVSGAHLILIETLFDKLFSRVPQSAQPASLYIKLALLALYSLACGLNPPITRSLISIFLTVYLLNKHIHWPWHFKVFAVGLLTLIFNHQWITSLSLQLSWLAAFTVRLGSSYFTTASPFFRQSLFFIILFPTIVFFQVPSLSTIFLNIILSPALEFLLFPLGLLVLIFNFLYPLFDFLILIFRKILEASEVDYRHQFYELPSYLVLCNWLLICSLHVLFHVLNIRTKRKSIND